MGRPLFAAVLSALVVTVGVGSAEAATFKQCGSAGTMYGGSVKLTKVQAKHTTCRKAKGFVRTYTKHSGPACAEDFYCTWRGWHCRNDGRQAGQIKHRCEAIDTMSHRIKVVRWVDRFETG
jgi:hypothetical protein